MIGISKLTLETDTGERTIYFSPLLLQLLQSKERSDIKSGKITILHLYTDLRDEDYKARVDPADLARLPEYENVVIYYGQDFEKYYLGSFRPDFENKRYWDWQGTRNEFSEQDVSKVAQYIFNPPPDPPYAIIFTPTRPSDFNLTRVIFKPDL